MEVGSQDSRVEHWPPEWVNSVAGSLPCLVRAWVLQEEAQDILTDDVLSSGSNAEMGWLPWNIQKAPTWTKVWEVL